ncbi:MAG: hypothetical protein L0Y71_17655 [Gemmataceae bacterium]|nr:hypothetical protein [Gemmataceae bacterium]
MKILQVLWLGPAALLMLVLAGCGRAPLTPVNGKVTYKGLALQSGVIVFTPDATRGERGAIAVGKIRDDGSYTLYTSDAAGAAAGWYRVTVSALAATSFSQPAGQGFAYPQSLVPEKYRDPDLSMLACEIKPGRTNAIDFNLD